MRVSACASAGASRRSTSTSSCSSATGSSVLPPTTTRFRSSRRTRSTPRSTRCLTEGLEQRWRRHAAVGAQLRAAIHDRGLELLSEPGYELPQLTAVRVPKGVDGRVVQRALAERHGIEIGAPLSDTGPAIWRIGLMGVNATAESVEAVVEALDDVLASQGVGVAA